MDDEMIVGNICNILPCAMYLQCVFVYTSERCSLQILQVLRNRFWFSGLIRLTDTPTCWLAPYNSISKIIVNESTLLETDITLHC